jgi:hypothetical protein
LEASRHLFNIKEDSALLLKSEVFMKKENCTGMEEGKTALAFASVCFSFLGDNQWK